MTKLEIDLGGPDGNAFALMAYAKSIGKMSGLTDGEIQQIVDDMQSGDYEHLLNVFQTHFGDLVNIIE